MVQVVLQVLLEQVVLLIQQVLQVQVQLRVHQEQVEQVFRRIIPLSAEFLMARLSKRAFQIILQIKSKFD